jgi:hypothetical protein
MEKCKTLTFNGYTGWRLPTRDVLKAMSGSWEKLGMKKSGVFFSEYWPSEKGTKRNPKGNQYEVVYIGWTRGGGVTISDSNANGRNGYARVVRSF